MKYKERERREKKWKRGKDYQEDRGGKIAEVAC